MVTSLNGVRVGSEWRKVGETNKGFAIYRHKITDLYGVELTPNCIEITTLEEIKDGMVRGDVIEDLSQANDVVIKTQSVALCPRLDYAALILSECAKCPFYMGLRWRDRSGPHIYDLVFATGETPNLGVHCLWKEEEG